MDPQLAAYLAVTTLLVITPGATTAVVVRNVFDGGAQRGMAAAVGAVVGNSTHATLSAIGLAAIFTRLPAAFLLLRAGGAVYLTFLGLRSVWGAWRPPPPSLPGGLERRGADASARAVRSGFTQGLAANLLNPAVAIFYLTVVPSFLNGSQRPGLRFALFAAIHVVMAFAFHSAWVWGLEAMRAEWTRPAVRTAVETLTGVALIALAVKVIGAP